MRRASIFLASLLVATAAMAHKAPSGWSYSGWCCNGTDCAQIPHEAVKVIEGGFQITLKPGDHPMVTRVHVFQIEMAKTKQSQDQFYHVCLWPNEDTLRCVYVPHMGF